MVDRVPTWHISPRTKNPMSKIYKYRLEFEETKFIMPVNAKIVTVGCQGDLPTIWAIGLADEPTECRTFKVMYTGDEFDPKEMTFIGTCFNDRFTLVLHVFEISWPLLKKH